MSGLCGGCPHSNLDSGCQIIYINGIPYCSLELKGKTFTSRETKEIPTFTTETITGRQVMFTVIDKKTGKYPDLEKIALEEDWAEGLIYCDMNGFAIFEDGNLVIMDECGNFAYCPVDRFEVVWEASK